MKVNKYGSKSSISLKLSLKGVNLWDSFTEKDLTISNDWKQLLDKLKIGVIFTFSQEASKYSTLEKNVYINVVKGYQKPQITSLCHELIHSLQHLTPIKDELEKLAKSKSNYQSIVTKVNNMYSQHHELEYVAWTLETEHELIFELVQKYLV